MHALQNLARREAVKVSERRLSSKRGTISALDLNTYTARVILHKNGHETGWLQIGTIAVGNGWGFMAPPDAGDEVLVVFAEGALNSGVITSRFFNVKKRPMTGIEPKEFALVHEQGAKLHFKANGDVVLESQNLTVNVNGDLDMTATGTIGLNGSAVNVTGDLDVTGDIDASGNIAAVGTVSGSNI